MQKPPIPSNETERLKSLESYQILDSLPDSTLDDLSLIASLVCDTPIALVSLIDNDRQWFKAKHGLETNETHRDISFCGHAINYPKKVFEVTDAKSDSRFKDNPLVTGELNIGFYAGVPLLDSNENAIGTLCVIDKKPKKLSEDQKRALKALAMQVMNHIELSKKSNDITRKAIAKNNALYEREKNYRKLYNQAPDMMVSIDPETRKIIDCNSTLCNKLGYKRKEVIGEDLFILYHEKHHDLVFEAFKEFKEKGVIIDKRLLVKTKSGEQIYVSLNVNSIRDKNGKMIQSISTYRDISDLVKIETELKNSNKRLEDEVRKRTEELKFNKERLEIALNGSNDGVWDWADLNSSREWWSPKYYELLGYEDGEIESTVETFSKILVHPEDENRLWDSFNHCIEKGIPMDDEYRLKTKGGEYKWFRGKANVIRDENGNATRIAGSISDINDQKNLELKLKETENFLTKVTDIAPSIIYVFNHETMSNEYSNKEIGHVLGYSKEEILEFGSQLIPSLCHPDDLALVFNHFEKILVLEKNKSITIEYRMKDKAGNYRWLLSEDTVFERNKNNKVIKHIGIATEITNIKLASEKLKNQTELLAEQNRDLKQFAYVATHDLKNPVLTLKGHFQFLEKSIPNQTAAIKESFEYIGEEIESFENTLKGLTEAIKIRENPIQFETIDINKLLHKNISLLKLQLNDIGGEINLSFNTDKQVLGTELYLNSTIQNILSNSLKYRNLSQKLKIKIETKEENDKLVLTISDNGLGIDLDLHRKRIFKMFNRFTDQAKGNGMGLYMIKHMVEKMEGTIKIESKVGEGTSIIITLKAS